MTSTDRNGAAIMRKAVQKLADRLPELADRLEADVLRGERERPPGLTDDLFEVCRIGLGHGIEAILKPDRGRPDLEWAEHLGRLRAQQGLPLEQLLRGYRLAGRVFWDGLVEVVSQDEPEFVPDLVHHATRTWHTIDEQSSAAAAAYQRTRYELLRRDEERTNAMVDALLEGQGVDGGVLGAALGVLNLPERGRYAVVVVGQHKEPVPPSTGTGIRFIWRMRADTQIALVALGTATTDELVATLRPGLHGNAGVSPVVHTLADLATARWLAELALRTCWSPEPEIAVLDRRLPGALVVSQPRLAGRLGRTVLGPLFEVDAVYRDVLLSTLTTWLECDGSASRAATRLYCHHNTVLNRLRRVEKLTGRLLSRPRDLTEVVLALNAVNLLDPSPDG